MRTISLWYPAEQPQALGYQHCLLPTVRSALGMAVQPAVATLWVASVSPQIGFHHLLHLPHSVCVGESPDSVGLEHF